MRKHHLLTAVATGAISILTAASVGAGSGTNGPERTTLPSSMWKDVDAVTVECALSGATAAQYKDICSRLMAAARINAPMEIKSGSGKATPSANNVALVIQGKVTGSQFAGTVALKRPAFRGENDEASSPLPVTLNLREKGLRADRSIHAALVRLLPWRQLKRSPHSPPRQY